jgi:lipoprotein-anchoring transpeptidase ErfK/SrfK
VTITIGAVLAAIVLQQPPPQAPVSSAPRLPNTSTSVPVPPALATQVMLDRAGFSPGPIDGRMGRNTRRALEAYEKQQGGTASANEPPLTTYTITPEDAQGPFVQAIPEDMVEKSKLPALGYTSIAEALAERFHSTAALLEQLNPGVTFEAGAAIQVPNVEPLVPPAMAAAPAEAPNAAPARSAPATPAGTSGRGGAKPEDTVRSRPDAVVTVRKSTSDLTVRDPSGRVLMFAPVTTGSEKDPLPIGEWKVTGVQLNPKFHYNPDLFWDADPSHSKAIIPPGPNNPVGLVWIDLNKPHYGIHGTPEPSTIGRTQSHGCVRLTNWDAMKLSGLVRPGTRVLFVE